MAELTGAGILVAAFTDLGKAVFWLAGKIGTTDFGAWLGLFSTEARREANMTLLRVVQYAAFAGIGIGLFAWAVGAAKGTL